MRSIRFWIFVIVNVFYTLRINGADILPHNEDANSSKQIKHIIEKRSLLQVFSKAQVSTDENENVNYTRILPVQETSDATKNNGYNRLGMLEIFSKAQVDSNANNDELPQKLKLLTKFKYDLGGNITSPQYPNPYLIPVSFNYSILLDGTLDLELEFDVFETRYLKDYIKITLQLMDQNEKLLSENSSILILSGKFNQPLRFYAKNYHHLKLEFNTQDKSANSKNSVGFSLLYKAVNINLQNTDGLLLPNTMTVLSSKLIEETTNINNREKISESVSNNLKKSFCDTVNSFSISSNSYKCDIDNVTQDLITENCLNSDTTQPDMQYISCIQVISAITLNFLSKIPEELLRDIISPNPHENLLFWLAGIFGCIVIGTIITMAVIRSDMCGMKTKFWKIPADESSVPIPPIVLSNHLDTVNNRKFLNNNNDDSYEIPSQTNQMTIIESNKSQVHGGLERAPSKKAKNEQAIERF